MFETFLQELAKVLQFSTLAPDQNGACLIVMKENKIPLLFELDEQLVPNKILVSSPVISFPIERRAEIYEECLKVNHGIEETISVKPDEDLIYLHRRISYEIQAKELEVIVHGFIKQINMMKGHVEQLLKQPPKHPKFPPPPSSIQVFPYKV